MDCGNKRSRLHAEDAVENYILHDFASKSWGIWTLKRKLNVGSEIESIQNISLALKVWQSVKAWLGGGLRTITLARKVYVDTCVTNYFQGFSWAYIYPDDAAKSCLKSGNTFLDIKPNFAVQTYPNYILNWFEYLW